MASIYVPCPPLDQRITVNASGDDYDVWARKDPLAATRVDQIIDFAADGIAYPYEQHRVLWTIRPIYGVEIHTGDTVTDADGNTWRILTCTQSAARHAFCELLCQTTQGARTA